jgi:hypothetical protein
MLSIDLAVNGRQIGHVAIVNKGSIGDRPGFDSYYWQSIVDDSFKPPATVAGFVEHRRSDGARALVLKVFEAMDA